MKFLQQITFEFFFSVPDNLGILSDIKYKINKIERLSEKKTPYMFPILQKEIKDVEEQNNIQEADSELATMYNQDPDFLKIFKLVMQKDKITYLMIEDE